MQSAGRSTAKDMAPRTRQERHFLRRALKLFGGVLGVAGVVFVLLELRENADQIGLANRGRAFWSMLGMLAVVYGLANALLARAWWLLLLARGADVSWMLALRTYGISQLAKYVPGNIFHLAGRQALGQAAGLPGKVVAQSIVYELLLIAGAGMLLFALIAPTLAFGMPSTWGLAMYLVLLPAALLGMRQRLTNLVARGFLMQSTFLALSGVVFLATLALVEPTSVQGGNWPLICGAYVTAWLIGFVTPGAPAGLGVRELVLLLVLDDVVSAGGLLAAVLLSRAVSMLGDVLFFGGAVALASRRFPR